MNDIERQLKEAVDAVDEALFYANLSPEAVQAFYDKEHGPGPFASRRWPYNHVASSVFIAAFLTTIDRRGLVIVGRRGPRN